MEWLGYAFIAVLMLGGFALLYVEIRTQRRWLRILLGLFTTWYLACCGAMSIYAIAALVAQAYVFVPMRSAE